MDNDKLIEMINQYSLLSVPFILLIGMYVLIQLNMGDN